MAVIGAAIAALTALAGLASAQQRKAEDKVKERRERQLQQQRAAAEILANRAALGGADTSQSSLASANNEFERQLLNSRRDTSGDWLPFVQGVAGVAQNVASDVGNAKPSASQAPMSKETLKPVFEQYGSPTDEDEQSFLLRLSKQNGWQG